MENQERDYQEIMRKLDILTELAEKRREAAEEKVIKGEKNNA